MSELVNEGRVYRARGKGTFVPPPKIRQKVSFVEGFRRRMEWLGLQTSTDLLEGERVRPSETVRSGLKLSRTQYVYRLLRLRLVEGEPMVLQTVFLPCDLFPNLLSKDLTGSLTDVMREHYGLAVNSYGATLAPMVAQGFHASILEVDVGTLLMRVEGSSLTETGRPIRYTRGVYRADRFEFKVEGRALWIATSPDKRCNSLTSIAQPKR
jgi:GntR family transcriptional regulator